MYGWATKITGIDYASNHGIDLGMSPAAVGMSSGMIYINEPVFNSLDDDEQYFVICHEWAHINGQTQDEELTDKIAFDEYKKSKRSLKASVYALAKILNDEHPRIELQLRRAQKFDRLKK